MSDQRAPIQGTPLSVEIKDKCMAMGYGPEVCKLVEILLSQNPPAHLEEEPRPPSLFLVPDPLHSEPASHQPSPDPRQMELFEL